MVASRVYQRLRSQEREACHPEAGMRIGNYAGTVGNSMWAQQIRGN